MAVYMPAGMLTSSIELSLPANDLRPDFFARHIQNFYTFFKIAVVVFEGKIQSIGCRIWMYSKFYLSGFIQPVDKSGFFIKP
jgi:hypothetical protein